MARILVAEDNDDLRQMLAVLLQEEGHEVTVARDGVEAFRAAQDSHFDLLITDYVMPIVDGADLTMTLHARPAPGAPPVIVYSAYMPEGKLEPLIKMSRVRFVSKGQRIEELLETVDDLLEAS